MLRQAATGCEFFWSFFKNITYIKCFHFEFLQIRFPDRLMLLRRNPSLDVLTQIIYNFLPVYF